MRDIVRVEAGSTILRGNDVQAFYTASGRDNGGIDPTDALQRLATATGKIHADKNRVRFTGFRDHKIIAEPDGRTCQTLEQSQAGPIVYAFRDPFVFRNPDDGRTYILFEGNTGGVAGAYQCKARDLGQLPPGHTVPADARFYTGEQGPVYGGTLAPTLRLDVRGQRSYVAEQLGYGYIPAT